MACNTNKLITCTDHPLAFTSGDTEFVRLKLKDSDYVAINLLAGFTCSLGIKKKVTDTEYVVPEKFATFYATEEPFTIEFKFTSTETSDLLSYTGKVKQDAKFRYDIELIDSSQSPSEITTILSGELFVSKSVAGAS